MPLARELEEPLREPKGPSRSNPEFVNHLERAIVRNGDNLKIEDQRWEDAMTTLNVNGQSVEVDVDGTTPLLWVLREQLDLTGTKYGCGVAQCGACTVHIDGVATRACVLPVSEVRPEQRIVTIEGLSPDGSHPVQQAWLELDVPQCGYCQTGMIMAVAALLEQNPSPSDADIDGEITNICRCGTYGRVRRAIKLAADSAGTVRQG